MGDERTQVEELRRVNAELAAEIRALSQGRTEKPRPGQIPAARGLARLLSERDSLAASLEEVEATLADTRADRDRLELQNRELDAEIVRLRSGFRGFLRRLRGRVAALFAAQ
jgi:cell division protein FtsB